MDQREAKTRVGFLTCVTMEAMMTPTLAGKTKKVLIGTGLIVLLSATTAWALPPRVSWQPEQLVPASLTPGESAEFVVTLKHTGFLPIPTQQLQIVATGDVSLFVTIVQPVWPPVLKRGNKVNVRLRVTVPSATPLSVKRGTLMIQRVLPNGKVKEVWRAETLPMELTFSAILLPPDPGTAGKADLFGIDTDQNGVRDDIDRYIVFTQPDSEKKREALKQSARALSAYLRDREDKGKTRENWKVNEKAMDCLYYVFDGDLDARDKAFEEMWASYLNTPARSIAKTKANSQMGGYGSNSGTVSEWEARLKFTCAFDADSLPN